MSDASDFLASEPFEVPVEDGFEMDPAVQQACVVVKDPDGHETTFALDRPVTTFGRDESNHICMKDKCCSRKHFVIEMAGDYYNAIDSGSTNKLRIQGRKLERRRLREGDVIHVGNFKVTYHGPSDDDAPDELLDAPLVSDAKSQDRSLTEENRGDTIPIPEGQVPEAPLLEPEPDPVDDAVTCPACNVPMPENAPCEKCGRKSTKLRAQEHYVDHIARGNSLLGGLGLWNLKRGKALEKAFAMEGVQWVMLVECEDCGKKQQIMNEFRIKCITCQHCGTEISLPVHEPPKL